MLGVQLGASVASAGGPIWVSPIALFVIVVIAASLCVVASIGVLVVAHRQALAELGLIGAFAFAVSVLPLVHGLTTPGVLYAPNLASMSSAFWALPLACVSLLPLALPRTELARTWTRHWRPFAFVNVAAITALSIGLLLWPSMLPVPAMNSRSATIAVVASLSICAALSAHHLRLSWISRTAQPFFVSLGFAMIGTSSLVWVAGGPFTIGFWMAHAFDIAGVLALTIGAAFTYNQGSSLREILEPLVAHTPLLAFEVGLDPLVHQFVGSLESKDPITRDHVVRTAELALRVGTAMRLPASQVRTLGLGALLHDIGKLSIPVEIIAKPGRLDAEEFAIMKGHAVAGERMVMGSATLGSIAPIVRGHHERIDGAGYPDGLAGEDLPLLARIVSVCDAFDAMSNTRQYRDGMGEDRAIAILREHSGSQWDGRVVEALVRTVRCKQQRVPALERVGRVVALESDIERLDWCGCGDAVPDVLVESISAGLPGHLR